MAGVTGTTQMKTERRGVFSEPDPIAAAPESYKVTFENDLIRVLDISLKKGKRSAMHTTSAKISCRRFRQVLTESFIVGTP